MSSGVGECVGPYSPTLTTTMADALFHVTSGGGSLLGDLPDLDDPAAKVVAE
jgi:hypothetical protein